MENAKHEWCRDTARDEAVRAAEDAAAVPAIQHRDLPDAVAELRERVARLEAVKAAAQPEPVAWGVLRQKIVVLADADHDHAKRNANNYGGTVVPLYAAPPEPRGWLTPEEREAVGWIVQFARHHAVPSAAVAHCNIETVDSLLARETPPRVKVPNRNVITTTAWARDIMWVDAIRAAGGEVE